MQFFEAGASCQKFGKQIGTFIIDIVLEKLDRAQFRTPSAYVQHLLQPIPCKPVH
jgi:hypothetical protein